MGKSPGSGKRSGGVGMTPIPLRLKEDDPIPLLPRGVSRGVLTWLRPLARALARGRFVSPDGLSVLSGGFAALGAWALLTKSWWIAATGFLFAGLADVLDGWVARLQGVASPRGELLDALMDRVVDLLFFAALAWVFRNEEKWLIPVFLAFWGSTAVTAANAQVELAGLRPPSGFFRRAGRSFLLFLGLLGAGLWERLGLEFEAFPLWLSLWSVGVGGAGSGILRVLRARRELLDVHTVIERLARHGE